MALGLACVDCGLCCVLFTLNCVICRKAWSSIMQ